MLTVTTPVPGYTGMSAGVNFTDGVALVDEDKQASAVRYFRGAGYGVDPVVESAPDEDQADGPPKKSATTDAWRAYAVKQGMPAEEAAQLNRDQLIERYASKETQS